MGKSDFAADLQAVGVDADSPWDLVNTKASYRAAMPVLLRWLDKVDEEVPAHERTKFYEGVVRALAVKEAQGIAVPPLLDAFARAGMDPFVRWAVGNSLSVVVADNKHFDDLARLATDPSFGTARQMLMLAVAKTKDPRALDLLVGLLHDDDVAGHALIALGRLDARRAASQIAEMQNHPRAWVRREAKKILSKMSE